MGEKRLGKFLVQQVTKATTKGGKTYLRLKLLEPGGRQWPGVMWEDRDLETGVIVDAMVEEGEFGGQAQLDVKALRVLADKPTDDFLPKTPHSVDGLYAELKQFVEQVENPSLRRLLENITNDARWRRAPAAITMHHAYLGGLLEHTVCLLRLARVVAELYQGEVRRDLLYAGAILHDMGKMNELSEGINIEYTTEGQLLGHIGIGLLRLNDLMNNDVAAFGTMNEPTDLRLNIMHIVASHHGSLQYGALKTPMTVEAQVFSNLDGIDANIAKMRAVIVRTGPGKEWSEKANWEEPKLFLGSVKK